MKKRKVKWIPNYSGHRSVPFWDFINKHKKHSEYYLLGVLLQNLEGSILREFNGEYDIPATYEAGVKSNKGGMK